jgi:hypothetical protein
LKNKTIVLLTLGCFIMLQALVSASELPAQKPGLYVNKEHRFSVAYPENWKPGTLLPGEVLRAANTNMYSLPVITASISDQKKDSALDPKVFIESAKKAEPGSDSYKVVSQEDLTLNDGTPAKVFTYEWTWSDGFTELVTGALITIKDGKYFSSTATTIVGGETSPEQLVEMVKGWKFY